MSYVYSPEGSGLQTTVEFLIEPKLRKRGVAFGEGSRLKIRQTGFSGDRTSSWLDELHDWDLRFTAIGESLYGTPSSNVKISRICQI